MPLEYFAYSSLKISLKISSTAITLCLTFLVNLNLNITNRYCGIVHFLPLVTPIAFQALEKAKISDPSKCHFVDDNLQNVQAAKKLGWGSCVYFRERRAIDGELRDKEEVEGVDATIESLEELRTLWKHVFKTEEVQASRTL
jgi:hypothetical protein